MSSGPARPIFQDVLPTPQLHEAARLVASAVEILHDITLRLDDLHRQIRNWPVYEDAPKTVTLVLEQTLREVMQRVGHNYTDPLSIGASADEWASMLRLAHSRANPGLRGKEYA